MRSTCLPLLLTLGSFACGAHPSAHSADVPYEITPMQAALEPLNTCDDVQNRLRNKAVATMHQRLDDAFESYKNRTLCYQTGPVPGSPATMPVASPVDFGPAAVSQTNNQVAGVDEADFVKNDNHYIYALADGALQIVEAWPAESAHLVSKTALSGTPIKLFINGTRALVFVSVGDDDAYPHFACTYGYDCTVAGDGKATRLLFYDIQDPTQPRETRRVDLSASWVAARRIGDTVHVVATATPDLDDLHLSLWPDTIDPCTFSEARLPQVAAALHELGRYNEEIIRAWNAALPTIEDSRDSSASSCANYYAGDDARGTAFIQLVSFDMMQDSPLQSQTVMSWPGFVYAAEDAVYMAVHNGQHTPMLDRSVVHKFAIGSQPNQTSYLASGVIPGHVINQYAMDSWEDHLRIATSVGWVPDPDVSSHVTVLGQRNNELHIVGAIKGIAPQEDIRAVRFAGPRGYVVTFKKTDPLFTLDLSQPQAPAIAGELKVPGFSTYLHMLDANHLLTLGYDAQDAGAFSWFTGILLQIFDVTDAAHPQQMFVETIGTRGTASDALVDSLAFNYFAPQNVLALPISLCEGSTPDIWDSRLTFSGLMLYDVTLEQGFALRGKVDHSGSYDEAATRHCSSWWSSSASTVKRSIFMDNFVYSVASDVITVASLGALDAPVASIRLAPIPESDPAEPVPAVSPMPIPAF